MRKRSGNILNRWMTLRRETMSHQPRGKIGCNVSKLFIQMNLSTQSCKKFALSCKKMNVKVNTRPLDFSITENDIRKAANKLENNKSTFSDKIRNEMR